MAQKREKQALQMRHYGKSCFLSYHGEAYGKPATRVRPHALDLKTSQPKKLLETPDSILIAVFCVNPLSLRERKGRVKRIHPNRLGAGAFKVKLDPGGVLVPEGYMAERIGFEMTAQFPIDSGEDILVEFCGNPCAIVVGCLQDITVLHEIGAKEQLVSGRQLPGDILQQGNGFVMFQVADA